VVAGGSPGDRDDGVRAAGLVVGRATVEVTFPASGAARYLCTLHAAQGMSGQLQAGPGRP
jgi:plastocyanin